MVRLIWIMDDFDKWYIYTGNEVDTKLCISLKLPGHYCISHNIAILVFLPLLSVQHKVEISFKEKTEW